jgi:cell fate regulator YaaT (PSP1 superfamily)
MPTSFVYLIQFGRLGFVGRFPSALTLARGEKVVVRGPRGVELGEVLIPTDSRLSGSADMEEGEILRVAAVEDESRTAHLDTRGCELIASATSRGCELGLPLAFVDIEVTLDGTAILHTLSWGECDATGLLDELATESGLAVRLLDLSRGPREAHTSSGCGKPGCGKESGGCASCGTGGGCSTGSCSRGSVKSSEELTAYFADLRRKMEDAGIARTPLN